MDSLLGQCIPPRHPRRVGPATAAHFSYLETDFAFDFVDVVKYSIFEKLVVMVYLNLFFD